MKRKVSDKWVSRERKGKGTSLTGREERREKGEIGRKINREEDRKGGTPGK